MAFPLVIVALFFAGAAAVVTNSESFVTIQTTPLRVTEGDTFTIDVSVTVSTPVNAVDIIIDYPEDQMEVTGIDTGESVITLWTQDPYAKNGKVYLSGGTFKKGFLGEHKIAKIKARATQSGIAQVLTDSIQLIAGDGLGTEVQVADTSDRGTRVYIANKEGKIEGTASVQIITDINGDGEVDLHDVTAFMSAWFGGSDIFDFNEDGKMTIRDFSILLAKAFFN